MNLKRLTIAVLLIASMAIVSLSLAQDATPKADGAGAAPPADAKANAAPKVASKPEGTAGASTTETKPAPAKVKKAPPPPAPPPKIPFHLQEYLVELPIVFAPSPKMGPAFRQAIIDDVKVRLDQAVGRLWQIDVLVEPEWLTPRNRVGLERLTMADLKPRMQSFSVVVALADLVRGETKGKVSIKLRQPLPLALEALGDELTTLDTDKSFDAQREDVLRRMLTELAGDKVDKDTADKIVQMMNLYVLPVPLIVDKSYPIAIEIEGSEFTISGREWDRDSELMTTVRSRTTHDRRMVATEIVRLISSLFHPVVQVENANPETATLRVKGGHFIASDPGFQQVATGALFAPFFRYLDKDRVVQRIQWLPWSYAVANEIDRARVQSALLSGVKTPLGAFGRRRMEIRGIAVKPHETETTLRLAPKRNLSKPLVGYLVAAYEELPPPIPETDEEKKAAEADVNRPKPVIYRSDRFGNVTIPLNETKPVVWLMVRSGGALLAKFPIVPGSESYMMVECPDDTIRLDVEGQMILLQSRLIDTIAKRFVVMAMIKNRSKTNDWKKVDESLKDLDSLVSFDDLKVMVTDIQSPAIEKAKSRGDTISAGRIQKLGQQVLKVAEHHLNAEKLKEFKEEIRELRAAGPEPEPSK